VESRIAAGNRRVINVRASVTTWRLANISRELRTTRYAYILTYHFATRSCWTFRVWGYTILLCFVFSYVMCLKQRKRTQRLCEVMASWNTGEILNNRYTTANQPQCNQVITTHVSTSVSNHNKPDHSMRERSGNANRLSYRTRSQCRHHQETRCHYGVLKRFALFLPDNGNTSSLLHPPLQTSLLNYIAR
jgi:hypothetical protein